MDIKYVKEKLKENKIAAFSVVLVIVILGIGVFFYVTRSSSTSDGDNPILNGGEEEMKPSGSDQKDNDCEIYIDISGAVLEPGVYCLDGQAINKDALDAAGGFSEGVCSNWVNKNLNLAALAVPNSKIYVPFEDDPECQSGAVESTAESESAADSKVSINTGSTSELESLPGVGPATAKKIIDGRPYSKLEDLLEVSGIGESTYEKLKDLICL